MSMVLNIYQSNNYWTALLQPYFSIVPPQLHPRLLYEFLKIPLEIICKQKAYIHEHKTFADVTMFLSTIVDYYSDIDMIRLIEYIDLIGEFSNCSPLQHHLKLRGKNIMPLVHRPHVLMAVIRIFNIRFGYELLVFIRQMIRRSNYQLMFEILAILPSIEIINVEGLTGEDQYERLINDTTIDNIIETTYIYIIKIGAIDVLKQLLEKYPLLDRYSLQNGLSAVTRLGRLDILELLCNNGISVSKELVGIAALGGHLDVFQFCVSKYTKKEIEEKI
jgi:hypothetical protein